ncbi:Gfo/Idh/MocA family oxidoreductase [Massilia agilis]|uniref:Gfo/Idh/MocA family oxidoreductase n=1 Tax=Massilia agilis TaxID=1811226 RepID=A0ABT2D816_9BURK|nr:Gfo/Idh/MocA family oxidoreductase [Massilia agilis]MCS0807444.1 Gfo/Idh/MocA family oxidoreductase [Massilia agilis]
MRTLVIGYGSIGTRHAALLEELGTEVALVSRRAAAERPVFADLETALRAHAPDYVVVANETSGHAPTLAQLADLDYRGVVLVEKPLFSAASGLPAHSFSFAGVAYNLRFHPVLKRLKSMLEGERVVSVHAQVGQYLPDWRPGTDYRHCYSASAQRGGGVLRDLSHELDYITWMLGGWCSVTAMGGHFSALEIDSDDVFSLLITTPRCRSVSVHLNYLERVPQRVITINTDRHTLRADLVNGTIAVDGKVEAIAVERNETYRAMHAAVMGRQPDVVCSLEQGLDTVILIDAACAAAQHRKWIDK